ncbi:unnamed protein product [Orchesella dallaii]|uniref:Uncharacterized protein n=1 Tax=Orchesella dallaii TaxID=48710 RepID=A0ABP1S6P8_9HEXA
MIPSTPSHAHHHHGRKKANPNAWKTPKAKAKFIFSQTWKLAFTILAPILYLVIFLWKPPKKQELAPHALYVIALMATYWISDSVGSVYFNNTIIFLFGGCVVALSFEYSNLHTRIAFFVMKFMGAEASM